MSLVQYASDSDSDFEPVRTTEDGKRDDTTQGDVTDSDAFDAMSWEHSSAHSLLGEGFKVQAALDLDDDEGDDADRTTSNKKSHNVRHHDKRVRLEPAFSTVVAAGASVSGPAASLSSTSIVPRPKFGESGIVQVIHTDSFLFDESLHRHNKTGVTLNPQIVSGVQTTKTSAVPLVGNPNMYSKETSDASVNDRKRSRACEQPREASSKDASDLEGYKGPWARYQTEVEAELRGPPELTEEQKKHRAAWLAKKISKGATLASAELEAEAKRLQEQKDRDKAEELAAALESTEFFGIGPLRNALGHSFVDYPPGVKPSSDDLLPPGTCYAPKSRVHTWNARTKGISSAKFFPKSGHLMLSAGMDGVARIYETFGTRPLMRTYTGHTQAIRDINFTDLGRKFFTCSYDKQVKLWDTETGSVIARYTAATTPYCVTPHPTENECLIGTHGKTVLQWDWRSNEVVQEYKEHLAAVNSIMFINDEQFISTSDDNKILVWDYGVPVVVRHIAAADLQSVPSVAMHPSGKYFVGNAQDNQTLVFACTPSVKLNRRKRFAGHNTSGFACGLTFSPDGQLVCSGDGEGRFFVWDWATGRLVRKIKAHEQVCVGVQWHPTDPSKLLTCSWDGTVKLWS